MQPRKAAKVCQSHYHYILLLFFASFLPRVVYTHSSFVMHAALYERERTHQHGLKSIVDLSLSQSLDLLYFSMELRVDGSLDDSTRPLTLGLWAFEKLKNGGKERVSE